MTVALDFNLMIALGTIIGAIIGYFSLSEKIKKQREADLIERTQKYAQLEQSQRDIDNLGKKVRENELAHREKFSEYEERIQETEKMLGVFNERTNQILEAINRLGERFDLHQQSHGEA